MMIRLVRLDLNSCFQEVFRFDQKFQVFDLYEDQDRISFMVSLILKLVTNEM